MPDVDAVQSATLLCDDDDKVREALEMLQQIGKESSKRINKRERKERKVNSLFSCCNFSFRPAEYILVNLFAD